ncbi:Rpp14/Pop5 family-domain-containing protein [Talaromyces proteolyticus]|uniref:Ribonuclease P/MRP protein subunit POP5 n=1 Tax=Talaromyces proteolyticus TaxID=1131652 RepID=A0AAD4KMW5_9EURO|nr:Rpp14/Pop5 family-domain-containing protein [Talaromyces proteolyticus]KAH8696313.1 Rpp14/Pop5 family-domain-containing protein [Talaromyces proteolyticus]
MVRIKHRYLLIDILYPEPPKSSSASVPRHLPFHPPTPDTLTPGLFAKLVRESICDIFGDYGVGKVGGASGGSLNVKYLSPATGTVILRCPRDAYRLVWAALTYMSSVPAPKKGGGGSGEGRSGNVPAVFRVVRVSGTMRKAEEEAIRRARREVFRTKGAVREGVEGLLRGISTGGGEDFVAFDMDEEEEG